ncbi:MAG: hypothetical protein U1A78_17045 [Polyangia bacterium]
MSILSSSSIFSILRSCRLLDHQPGLRDPFLYMGMERAVRRAASGFHQQEGAFAVGARALPPPVAALYSSAARRKDDRACVFFETCGRGSCLPVRSRT